LGFKGWVSSFRKGMHLKTGKGPVKVISKI